MTDTSYKNKTLCCLLAAVAGALGLHRFYLYGWRDIPGRIYLATTTIYLIVLVTFWGTQSVAMNIVHLFPAPMFVAVVEALMIGLTDDGKWDQRHNLQSTCRSRSRWPLAVILVLTLFIGYTAMVASLARATDLLFTGGSYG